jgi:hypothetical protein
VRYGVTVEVRNDTAGFHLLGGVNGKLKGTDAYVVEIGNGKPDRTPNRHLELEWGHWSGREGECIVLAEEIVRIHER